MDIARWGLNRRALPKRVVYVSSGGKNVYDDDQETPNTQIASFDYGDAELVFEVRGFPDRWRGDDRAGRPEFRPATSFLASGAICRVDHARATRRSSVRSGSRGHRERPSQGRNRSARTGSTSWMR